MQISIIVFDDFTDLDLFLPWDLLSRVKSEDKWEVRLLGDKEEHRSKAGLIVPMHGPVEEANSSDVVLFGSGPATRHKCRDPEYLRLFKLNHDHQLISSMCSGALMLAALGFLNGIEATTYPTAVSDLESFGVKVVQRPFVQVGNIATAAGCLAAVDLVSWIIERKIGPAARDEVLQSVSPVGRNFVPLHFTNF
ncbi:MAG: DJ-1/PfpI family protein [Proteobacteria bacterium]|nr:DJ-1/PfpI family protein [Pseudomonadota bacterium]